MNWWPIVWHGLLVVSGGLTFGLAVTGLVVALIEFVDAWADRREAQRKAKESAAREIARTQAETNAAIQRLEQTYVQASEQLRRLSRGDRS